MPTLAPKHIGDFANCRVHHDPSLQHRDDACLTDALPRQAQHEGVKLRARQPQGGAGIFGPDELALVQPPGGQPHANAVVHEHLHSIGPAVGEQVGVVRTGQAKDVDHACQRRFAARTHVQRCNGKPHGFDVSVRSAPH